MPLPRSLSSSSGRRKAAVLLAATRGKPLKLRFLPSRPTYTQPEAAASEIRVEEDRPSIPDVKTLRDPFGEFSGKQTESTVKLPQIN